MQTVALCFTCCAGDRSLAGSSFLSIMLPGCFMIFSLRSIKFGGSDAPFSEAFAELLLDTVKAKRSMAAMKTH